MRRAGGRGALLAFGAFEKPDPVFRPTSSAPDPQTFRDALNARDANEWRVPMNIEIENTRRSSVITSVPCRLNANIITPRWIFHWKFESVKHKARPVAREFAHVFGVDYNEAHLYASVMRFEPFRVLASIAALFDPDLRPSNVSAVHLHGDIAGEVYMEPRSVLEGNETRPTAETHAYFIIYNYTNNESLYAFPQLRVAGSEGGHAGVFRQPITRAAGQLLFSTRPCCRCPLSTVFCKTTRP